MNNLLIFSRWERAFPNFHMILQTIVHYLKVLYNTLKIFIKHQKLGANRKSLGPDQLGFN